MLVLILRAAVLDGRIYEDMGVEPDTMFRALGVVMVAAIAFGLGIRNETIIGLEDAQILVMLVAISSTVLGWLLWGFVAYVIGRLVGGRAAFRVVLRALGIAYGPGALMVFFGIPVSVLIFGTPVTVGGLILTFARFWLLAAGLVAVSETHGYGLLRGFFPTLIGWYMALWLLPAFLLPIG